MIKKMIRFLKIDAAIAIALLIIGTLAYSGILSSSPWVSYALICAGAGVVGFDLLSLVSATIIGYSRFAKIRPKW